jgi:hypothetical protein
MTVVCEVCTVFYHPNTGILDSNLSLGMEMCLHVSCVVLLGVRGGFETGLSPVSEVLSNFYKDSKTKKAQERTAPLCHTGTRRMWYRHNLLQLVVLCVLPLSMILQSFGTWQFFSFLILYTVDRTARSDYKAVARPLSIHKRTRTRNKRTQKFMPQMEFESTIPLFKRAKTVDDLDRETTVIGVLMSYS